MYNEASVLASVSPGVRGCPQILYEAPGFLIEERVNGRPLSELLGEGKPLPWQALATLGGLPEQLVRVSASSITMLSAECRFAQIPFSDCVAFSDLLRRWLSRVYDSSGDNVIDQIAACGITANPFGKPWQLADPSRALRLCHGDLTPDNCLWDGRQLSIIDWELALLGDPAFDTASLLHRFSFTPEVEEGFLVEASEAVPASHRAAFRADVDAYRQQEVARSIVLDAVRRVTFVRPS
jgi:hypothetical protein